MIVVVDERATVSDGYTSLFNREGVSAFGIVPGEFEGWITAVSDDDIVSVEAVLLGESGNRCVLAKAIRSRSCGAAIIAMNETRALEETLELFSAGVDDVVRKPIHVRELLARIKAIRRRASGAPEFTDVGDMRIYFDGRDPEISGEPLQLPRRERRILEYLVANRGCRINKTQIFNSVYGLFSEDIDENVVESHISKLRKRLRHRLGFDPIDSKRYLGYRLVVDGPHQKATPGEGSSLTQDVNDQMRGDHLARKEVVA